MAGLDPAIHVVRIQNKKEVDARHSAGHDDIETLRNIKSRKRNRRYFIRSGSAL